MVQSAWAFVTDFNTTGKSQESAGIQMTQLSQPKNVEEFHILAQQFADMYLQTENLRSHFRITKKFKHLIRQRFKKHLQLAFNQKKLFAKYDTNGNLSYAFALYKDKGVIVAHELNAITFASTVKGQAALKKELAKLKIPKNTHLPLLNSQKSFVPFFQKLGFCVDAVVLKGRPNDALKKLEDDECSIRNLNKFKLKFRRLKKEDIPSVIKLFKREFTKNPQFGWFCQTPQYLKARADGFKTNLKNKHHFSIVIVDASDKVLGYFGAYATPDPIWNLAVGNEIVLHEKLQGKKISKIAYRHMFEWMLKNKAGCYKGGTAQPSVMALGKKWKRWPELYLLRKAKGHFQPSHFTGLENY